MSYVRTLKDGTKKRFYTAKERAKQSQRNYARPDYAVTRSLKAQKLGTKRIREQVAFVWRVYNYAELLRWHADQLRMAEEWRKHIHADLRLARLGIYTPACSAGGLDYARGMLNVVLAEIKFTEAVIYAYNRT